MKKIIDKNVHNQGIVDEFFKIKKMVDGRSEWDLDAKFTLDKDTLGSYDIVYSPIREYVSTARVYFDKDRRNARLSYVSVLVFNEDPNKLAYEIDVYQLMQQMAESALNEICAWMKSRGVVFAGVCKERDKIAGIEFTIRASDGQERDFHANFRNEDLDAVVSSHGWFKWLTNELLSLHKTYDVDEDVLANIKRCRKFGVRTVLESCEEIKEKLIDMASEAEKQSIQNKQL